MAANTDPTERFFASLAARGHEPLLEKTTASVRFEVVDGRKVRRYGLAIDRGELAVTAAPSGPSCVVRADKAVFDMLVSGRANAVAAVLRGDLLVEGDWRLLVRLQRLFPGPPRKRRPA